METRKCNEEKELFEQCISCEDALEDKTKLNFGKILAQGDVWTSTEKR